MRKSIFSPEQEKLLVLLRRVRREARLSQAELARRLGSSQSFVSKYEIGEHRLDLLQLRQICLAVGIPLEEFIERFEDMLQ